LGRVLPGLYGDTAGNDSGRRSGSAGSGYGYAMTTSQLARPRNGKMIAGVCAGLGNRFGVSTGLIRLAFVIFGLVGAGELVYIVLWILMPKE
jgi:phage shock protein C